VHFNFQVNSFMGSENKSVSGWNNMIMFWILGIPTQTISSTTG